MGVLTIRALLFGVYIMDASEIPPKSPYVGLGAVWTSETSVLFLPSALRKTELGT